MVWVASELWGTAALGEALLAPVTSTAQEQSGTLAYLLTSKSPLQSSSPETLQSGKYSSKYFKDFESWNRSSCDFSIGWGKSNTCPCYHPAGRQLWLISRMTANRAALEDSLCAVFSGTKHTSYSLSAVLPVVSHLAHLRTISHPLTGKLQSHEAQNEQGRFSWVLECWGRE